MPVTRFRNFSIGTKVAVLIGSACAVALLLTGAAMGAYGLWQTRTNTVREFTVHARILAANTSAALVFNDRAMADEQLRALRLKPHILHAFLLRQDGTVFSRFDRDRDGMRTPPTVPAEPAQFDGPRLLVAEPVVVDGQNRGTLLLEIDYADIRRELLMPQFAIIALISFASLLLALGFAAVLRGVVARPLRGLAQTAHRVSVERDYSVRVAVAGRDEVGQLAEAFNIMLARIEEADRDLHDAHARLTAAMAEQVRLQEVLVDASRRAGMAEVATGVLHNVGNVLNSVNVSASLMRERLAQASVSALPRAVELLRQHAADLPHFLTADPRGRNFVAFLDQNARHLASENAAFRAELENICHHIDHIKEIVAVQQNFAGHGGLLERLAPAQLFDSALRMQEESCRRHGVTVVRDYADVPLLTVEKHGVIQILVNLVANAVAAIEAGGNPERRLVVRLARAGETRIQFAVVDTGIGIPAENLTRIFSHGFTTRRDGRGFGLHSSANAARILGGTLSATSPGPGAGATFTLELPLDRGTAESA